MVDGRWKASEGLKWNGIVPDNNRKLHIVEVSPLFFPSIYGLAANKSCKKIFTHWTA